MNDDRDERRLGLFEAIPVVIVVYLIGACLWLIAKEML